MNNRHRITNAKAQGLRIIAGRFRGRKIQLTTNPQCRPTPNRLRETLFNWLAPDIVDSVCLDLFTGSGALSLEAISRGAKQVIAVDNHAESLQHIQATALAWGVNNLHCQQQQLPAQLAIEPHSINIVFMDPPFQQNLVEPCCAWLANTDYLAPHALIYIETEIQACPIQLPSNWEIIKGKQTQQIYYALIRTP